MKVKLSPSQKVTVANSSDMFHIMREILHRERKVDRTKEHFWVMCLAANNKLLLIELVSFGSKVTNVDPTDVFGFALQKKTAKIILVHSHKNGVITPTQNDKGLTERMAAVGDFVRLPVVDHLLIKEDAYYSFSDKGLLQQIKDNSNIDLTFSNVDKLKAKLDATEAMAKWELKRAEERMLEVEKKADRRIESAEEKVRTVRQALKVTVKKLLRSGTSVTEIVSLTGLTKKEVEKLK